MSYLVALEGIDGSGKGTQAQRLLEQLRRSGQRTTLFSFPRYEQTLFGRAVADFLNGRFGRIDEVDPSLVSLLYSGDRLESRELLVEALAQHDAVICDRYVSSNVAHQVAKVTGSRRQALIDWIRQVEYEIYRLPRPDLIVLLDIPVNHAVRLIAAKQPRTYTDQPADLHEADERYLREVGDVYRQLAADPDWCVIECVAAGRMRPVDDVGEEILRTVHDRMPPRRASTTPSLTELARQRRAWIDETLAPWCRRATRQELRLAELDWTNLAGRVDPEATLWRWAWRRFPDLVHDELGIDESHAVRITLQDGTSLTGYPDARRSLQGELVLVPCGDEPQREPVSLDQIAAVERVRA